MTLFKATAKGCAHSKNFPEDSAKNSATVQRYARESCQKRICWATKEEFSVDKKEK